MRALAPALVVLPLLTVPAPPASTAASAAPTPFAASAALAEPADATSFAPDPWLEGVGETASARLSMLYEATIFRVDVARVEARLDSALAERIEALTTEGEYRDQREAVEAALLEAHTFTVGMAFLRDAGWDRFRDGTRDNMKGAAEVGLISDDEYERFYADFVSDFQPLHDRGVKKGDAILYRVDGDRVRIRYTDAAGETLVEIDREGTRRGAATRGAYFARTSEFSEKLIRSAFEGER